MFNALMLRLHYFSYIASNTGSGVTSPAYIDYHILRNLAVNHAENCLGIHAISPPLSHPMFLSASWQWLKFRFARFFYANIFVYTSSDFYSLSTNNKSYHQGPPIGNVESSNPISSNTEPKPDPGIRSGILTTICEN